MPPLERFDVLTALWAHGRAGLLAQAASAVLVPWGYFQAADVWTCVLWSLCLLMAIGARTRALWWLRTRRMGSKADERSARRAWDHANLLSGMLWGVTALLFYGSSDASQRIGLTVLVCALCVAQPASGYRVYLATMALGFCSLMVVVLLQAPTHGPALAWVLGLVYAMAAWQALYCRRAFGQLLGAMRRAEALATMLADETHHADAARTEAEAATASRSHFFAAASHDLRQPLQAMLLFADALVHHPLPAASAQLVAQLSQSARSLEVLFDDLLDMSQLDAGAVQVRVRPVALESIYRSVSQHCRPPAFDRGLALDFRGGHRWVRADPVLLERLLRNLVSNAVNHTTDGGVLVCCRPRGSDQWVLQVWDTGCGIPEEALPHVFEQFYRGAAPKGRGLGLGLTIAQAFAGLMGSRLSVRSTPGRGSVFTLVLPRAEAAAAVIGTDGVAGRPAWGSLTGCDLVVMAQGLAAADQVGEQLLLWRAGVHVVADTPALVHWVDTRRLGGLSAPTGLVLGGVSPDEQAIVLAAWRRAWPETPAALLLMAPATHPAVDWPVLVRLSQPLAAHRLRASVAALCSRCASPDTH